MSSPFDLSALAGAVGGEVTVQIESAVAPPIIIAPFSSSDPSSLPSAVVDLVKPKVTVFLNGQQIGSVAPAGDPPSVPWVGFGAIVAIIAFGAGCYALGRFA